MNIKQKLSEFIIKYKNHLNYEPLVNDLCRLYFEVEEQERKESPFEGSQVREVKDDLITEQSLFSLGFSKQFGIKNQYLCDSPKIRISLKMKNNIIYILNIDFKCLDYNDFLIENLEIKSIKEFQTMLIILSKIEP